MHNEFTEKKTRQAKENAGTDYKKSPSQKDREQFPQIDFQYVVSVSH
jgi:hypothetical protein